MAKQRNKRLVLAIFLVAVCVLFFLIGVSAFVLTAPPPPQHSVDNTSAPSSAPTGSPTGTSRPTGSPTPAVPTISPAPTVPSAGSSCICASDQQPVYNNFKHPDHTDESYAVFNFYNDNGTNADGSSLMAWVSVFITADIQMQQNDPRFVVGYTYVYVDAHPLARGSNFSYVMHKATTSGGRTGGNGRSPGGRIVVYYRDPQTFDPLKAPGAKYENGYPLLSPGNIVAISSSTPEDDNTRATPSNDYSQLLEFTLDVDNTGRPFIDYDLSAVDTIAMPVYIFGGYDPETLPEATTGNNNNGFPCGKAYIGCTRVHETTEGCPTQIMQETEHGSVCISPIKYCSMARDSTLESTAAILNKTNWHEMCHKFDAIANGFNITQEQLDFYFLCTDVPGTPGCPPFPLPLVRTPSAVIYACSGEFLLENHCIPGKWRFTRSHLDGAQCSAINRGLCFQPNYNHIPVPDGLSCSRFSCPGNPPGVSCLLPCTNYETCFGFLCADYNKPTTLFTNITCATTSCDVSSLLNCADNIQPITKDPKESLCNDSTPDPYTHGLMQNDYAAWARNKGERYYAFSLDEEVGGGNQQCLYSTQLDVVIYPRCNGNYRG